MLVNASDRFSDGAAAAWRTAVGGDAVVSAVVTISTAIVDADAVWVATLTGGQAVYVGIPTSRSNRFADS